MILHITSVLLACIAVFFLSFYQAGFSYQDSLGTLAHILTYSAGVYAFCFILSPWLTVYLSYRGRVLNSVFLILLVLTVSGGLFLLFPLFDILTGGWSSFLITAIPATLLATHMGAGKLFEKSMGSAQNAHERGLKSSYIIRRVIYKSARSLFFKNTGQLFIFITTVFTLSEILLKGFKIPPSLIGLWACALLIIELVGFILYKCTDRG